jgi:hypothetical protein
MSTTDPVVGAEPLPGQIRNGSAHRADSPLLRCHSARDHRMELIP